MMPENVRRTQTWMNWRMRRYVSTCRALPVNGFTTRSRWTLPHDSWNMASRIESDGDTLTRGLSSSSSTSTHNNNNNNAGTMFMVLSSWTIATARVHPVHLDECRSACQAAADPPTKPTNLGVESACIWLRHDLHPPSPFNYYSARKLSSIQKAPNCAISCLTLTEVQPQGHLSTTTFGSDTNATVSYHHHADTC